MLYDEGMEDHALTLQIRSVPASVARRFRAEAAIRGMTLGELLMWLVDNSLETAPVGLEGVSISAGSPTGA